MLHVLLIILKILGILLLCMVGLLLLLAALVLFVPIRYRIKASKADTIEGIMADKEQKPALTESLYARVKVTWLLHLLSMTLQYQGELLCKIRVFGIVIYDLSKREEKARKREEKQQRKDGKPNKRKRRTETQEQEEEQNQETCNERQEPLLDQTDTTADKRTAKETDAPLQIEQTQKKTTKASLTDKIKQFILKIKEFFSKILQFLRNIRYTFTAFCDKIKGVFYQAAYYKEILEKEETKLAFAVCKKQLGRLLKHLKPSEFQAQIRFGLEDPAATGQIVSVYSMLYPFLGEQVHILPDFEHRVLEGSLAVKGRVTAFILLRTAWILYFDKNIKYLLHRLKKEDK